MKTREVIISCLTNHHHNYSLYSKEIEKVLNQYIDLSKFSKDVKQIQFTYLPNDHHHPLQEYKYLTKYNEDFVIDMSLIVDIPNTGKKDEDVIMQKMAELFLESILLYPKLIRQFDFERFYNEVRDIFAKMAWTSRELFLVA